MRFAWDESKRLENIKKHGIDFYDVRSAFSAPMIANYDTRRDYEEDRWIGIGLMKDVVIVVAFSEPNSNQTRIISARKATKRERKLYEDEIENHLE